MDLGCIDLGCVEKASTGGSDEKENIQREFSEASASKLGKNIRAKDALRSSLTALNRLTSQISKPPHRKPSPINWFPRKKVEPYLKRKIKMLQEVDGMHSTLDETLGDSNPHYCRVLREKIAIREAAEKAMESGKAAMVEASWCRILQAARIECKEAEARRSKAEKDAAEAFEEAQRAGVIMNDIPDCAQNHYKIDTAASGKGGGSMNHSISADFETAFDVDKQVAAAVKAAFIKLASSSSTSKEDFKEVLRKISENPDKDEDRLLNSECDSDAAPEVAKSGEGNLVSDERMMRKAKKKQDSEKFSMDYMVDMMLGRLQCLKDDELASLASIVATSGLNAALSEMGTAKKSSLEGSSNTNSQAGGNSNSRRFSLGGNVSRRNATIARNTADTELPSLDKFLVKRLTRLEREVLEAKNRRQQEDESRNGNKRKLDITDEKIPSSGIKSPRMQPEDVSDLGSDQVKLSQGIEKVDEQLPKTDRVKCAKQDISDLPSLDKFLVKHLSRLEREVLEAKSSKEKTEVKEKAPPSRSSGGITREEENNHESLDKVLVKHVSRLEKEKEAAASEWKPRKKDVNKHEGSLDQLLVKHTSRLEKEKIAAAEQQDGADAAARRFASRKEARERELQAAWGGLSLGNSMQRHVSRLEKDKAAWIEAEEEERRNRALEKE